MKEGEWQTVGAKKNADGSMDLSHAAPFKLGKIQAGEAEQQSDLKREQREAVEANKNKGKALFEALERGGGSVEVQEAKMKVKDLTEGLERFRKDPRRHGEDETKTIEWYKREISLNQRVINGEKLVDVLDSMQLEEDKKRIAEAREKIKNMRQE